MDDTKRYTIQVKGTAYKFAPLDLEAVSRLRLIQYMDVSEGVTVKAVMGLLSQTMDSDSWDELATRLVNGEVPLTEVQVILEKLIKRTLKDHSPSADE